LYRKPARACVQTRSELENQCIDSLSLVRRSHLQPPANTSAPLELSMALAQSHLPQPVFRSSAPLRLSLALGLCVSAPPWPLALAPLPLALIPLALIPLPLAQHACASSLTLTVLTALFREQAASLKMTYRTPRSCSKKTSFSCYSSRHVRHTDGRRSQLYLEASICIYGVNTFLRQMIRFVDTEGIASQYHFNGAGHGT
jgi:hypothetical protein